MYDIFFLSHGERMADLHWQYLHEAQPHARRVDGIAGILAAHRTCATRAMTNNFFVVDADNEVLKSDAFGIRLPDYDQQYVHVWRARNPVNGLEYGWGGIKLFPRRLLLETTDMPLDMTTSFPLKVMPTIASITHFNTSGFDTWRSAFRECCKLALANDPIATERLDVWTNVARGPYANECLHGASSGRDYGVAHRQDMTALQNINDWHWLKEQFDASCH